MHVLLHEGHTEAAATATTADPATMAVTAVGLVLVAALLGYGVKRVAGD
ncbi:MULTISPECIES: hypothetical protein [unclassified Haloparvum]